MLGHAMTSRKLTGKCRPYINRVICAGRLLASSADTLIGDTPYTDLEYCKENDPNISDKSFLVQFTINVSDTFT